MLDSYHGRSNSSEGPLFLYIILSILPKCLSPVMLQIWRLGVIMRLFQWEQAPPRPQNRETPGWIRERGGAEAADQRVHPDKYDKNVPNPLISLDLVYNFGSAALQSSAVRSRESERRDRRRAERKNSWWQHASCWHHSDEKRPSAFKGSEM